MEQLLIFPPWSTLYPQADPILRGSDVLFQQLPWHHWIQDELSAGRFPLWVSGPLGGYPLFAYYQAGVLYPLHLLWALLPTGVGTGIIAGAQAVDRRAGDVVVPARARAAHVRFTAGCARLHVLGRLDRVAALEPHQRVYPSALAVLGGL